MNIVVLIWDGNEIWLVLGGVGLLVVFFKVYVVLLLVLYLLVLVLVVVLVFCGVVFEFCFKVYWLCWLWSVVFGFGLLLVMFV